MERIFGMVTNTACRSQFHTGTEEIKVVVDGMDSDDGSTKRVLVSTTAVFTKLSPKLAEGYQR